MRIISSLHRFNIGKLKKCDYLLSNGKICDKFCPTGKDQCKLHSEKHLAYLEQYKTKHNEISRRYKANNRDKIKQYYEENKEDILAKNKEYYEENKAEVLTRNKEYYERMRYDSHTVIRDKIRGLRKFDIKVKRTINDDNFINEDWVRQQLSILKNKCFYCHCDLILLGFDSYDKKQFSIDRIDNSKAHHMDNCVISCLECNLKKVNLK